MAAYILGLAGDNCEKCIDRLFEIAMTGEPKESIRACEVLLARAVGKVPDVVIDETKSDITPEEELAIVAEIAREHLSTLTPEEKLKLLTTSEPSVTVQ